MIKREYNSKYDYSIGAKFQNYTIKSKLITDKYNHKYFIVECNCGATYKFSKKQLTIKIASDTKWCKKCKPKGLDTRNMKPPSYMLPEVGLAFISGKLGKL